MFSIRNIDSGIYARNHIDAVSSEATPLFITATDVFDSLKETKLRKSAEIDGLAAEYFVYSHSSISVHLSLLFT